MPKNNPVSLLSGIPDEHFLELQFLTLRKEIEDAKGRAFKILAGEAFAIPIAQFLIGMNVSKDVGLVKVFLPFLILTLVLRFLYENNSIIRCGMYIRYYIEPFYIKNHTKCRNINNAENCCKGWEDWLEEINFRKGNKLKCNHRQVEIMMKYSFYILSLIYYIFSIATAERFVEDKYPEISWLGVTIQDPSYYLLIIYIILLMIIIYLCSLVETSTTLQYIFVFNWDKIPGEDNEILKEFLIDIFDVDWVANAKIEKLDDGKTIKISAGKKIISLKLRDRKNEAILEIDDNEISRFIVKMENNEQNIYWKKEKESK